VTTLGEPAFKVWSMNGVSSAFGHFACVRCASGVVWYQWCVFYKESGIKTTSSLDFLLEECASFS